MKIRKVEIDGFRIYKNKQNGTFDFSYSNDISEGIADFVSIWAPNGFGKTSFYDAVEWAFTKRIKRLDDIRKFDDLSQGERKQNKAPQYILRNKDLPSEHKGSVSITLKKDYKQIPSEKLVKKRSGSTDYKYLTPKKLEQTIERNLHD